MTDADERAEQVGHTSAHAEQASATPQALDVQLLSVVRRPLFCDTFQALFACQLLGCSPGWPRLVAPEGPVRTMAGPRGTARDWLRSGDVLVELSRAPSDEPLEVGLSLSADSAARLVDAQLGGRVASSLAGAAGQLSEAECGVLAYAAARLLSAAGLSFRLRDVRPAHADDVTAARMVWPLALQSSAGVLDVALWLSPALADASRRHLLELALHESADQAALSGLSRGDVWISESSSLTLTSQGLSGPVVLSVPGTVTRLAGQLRRARVHARAPWPRETNDLGSSSTALGPRATVELVIARRALSLLQLAELASGSAVAIDCSGHEPACLRSEGITLARGPLISWRGALGLRVDELADGA